MNDAFKHNNREPFRKVRSQNLPSQANSATTSEQTPEASRLYRTCDEKHFSRGRVLPLPFATIMRKSFVFRVVEEATSPD